MKRAFLSPFALAWVAPGACLLFFACADPVLSNSVAALGKETAGIDTGEYHRAGQPCTVCHGEGGPASDKPFTVAGTVFAQPLREVGVEGAEVRMTDADGTKYTAKTNCVGNFMVTADQWDPKFPVLVEIAKNNTKRSMQTAIGREPSCGNCHTVSLMPDSPLSQVDHVYLFGGDEPGSPNGAKDCPVDPVLAGSP